MSSSRKPRPIIGFRIALRPIYFDNGQRILGKEIAAQVMAIPDDCAYMQRIETRNTYLKTDGEKALFYGPDFVMVPGE